MRSNKASVSTVQPTISTNYSLQKMKATRDKKTTSNEHTPIFLRKTYHMIESCDPNIAAWSDEGDTFVVKQPDVFEKSIIPQFFKHSKFSSFVRQLNFYGFRKIKYSDTIKIDVKLEAETANFWRFKHESFIRGKPELLSEIRRHNSQSISEKNKVEEKNSPEVEVTNLKSEVDILKDKIADMTKNIDDLTALVQNVSVDERKSQVTMSTSVAAEDGFFAPGNKRKKLVQPEPVLSTHMVADDIRSDNPLNVENLVEMSFTPGTIFPSLSLAQRQESSCTNVSHDTFMEQMLGTLEDELDILPDTILSDEIADAVLETPQKEAQASSPDHQLPLNAPDPELMKQLSTALSVLPHKVQEMLVNRLIATITSPDALKSHIDASAESYAEVEPKVKTPPEIISNQNTELALPMAVAALGAILSQCSATSLNKEKIVHRSLPVIPMHA